MDGKAGLLVVQFAAALFANGLHRMLSFVKTWQNVHGQMLLIFSF
jgi:hypothetical protein